MSVGALLACREINYRKSKDEFYHRILPTIGMYLCVYSILYFDHRTPHPGFHTIIPVLGVTLIIAFSSKDELVGKILGSKCVVYIGLLSYSLYMWHYPIFAFSVMTDSLNNFNKLELIVLIIICQ